jgi:poly-gamma-glutamate capsule biosynthesis protein CapA/YwtB (metallophosphatase superfamily)
MVRLFLAGDVMTGRGIDQILAHPSSPELYEDYVKSALNYTTLAERASGAIQRPASYSWIWGDALEELSRAKPDARIVNLETAVTCSSKPEPKGINYRMNPANMAVLKTAGIDCCVLANNHVLDWGEQGLLDTLAALKDCKILTAGAGRNVEEAREPAVLAGPGSSRICVFGAAHASSGIPWNWAATRERPGINLLPDLSGETARELALAVEARKTPGAIVVLSIHWGSNWGYEIPLEQRAFAHALVDLGACDILHGHSSHHARAAEIYRGKPILYGCGDFINDYEGIPGQEDYRGDLAAMYLADIDETDGTLKALQVSLFQMHRFRLRRALPRDIVWFQATLNRQSEGLGVRFSLNPGGNLFANS